MSESSSEPSAAEFRDRLRALTPEDTRRWGQMTAHQAVCHLRDALRGMIHHEPVAPVHNLFTRTVMRWVALHSGMAWPRGVKMVRELDAQQGGSHPRNFAQPLTGEQERLDE